MYIVEHDKEHRQFTVQLEGKIAALRYRILPNRDVWELYSTFVPPQFRGRSIGLVLVEHALNYAKKHHLQIIPSCPFVRHFINMNPEYEKLVYKDV